MHPFIVASVLTPGDDYKPEYGGSQRHRAQQLSRHIKACQRQCSECREVSWVLDGSRFSGKSVLLCAVMDNASGVTAWAPPQVDM